MSTFLWVVYGVLFFPGLLFALAYMEGMTPREFVRLLRDRRTR